MLTFLYFTQPLLFRSDSQSPDAVGEVRKTLHQACLRRKTKKSQNYIKFPATPVELNLDDHLLGNVDDFMGSLDTNEVIGELDQSEEAKMKSM